MTTQPSVFFFFFEKTKTENSMLRTKSADRKFETLSLFLFETFEILSELLKSFFNF